MELNALYPNQKLFFIMYKLEKMGVGVEGGADVEHQSGGFGTTGEGAPKDDSKNMPYSIQSEEGMKKKIKMRKASYEYVSPVGQSYTDESNPRDDSFYLPAKLDSESGDRSKDAKEKQEKSKKAMRENFGKIEENIANDGRARVNQNFNVGTLENSQIGNQGGSMDKASGKLKRKWDMEKKKWVDLEKGAIKKPVKTKEADKNFKPKDEYFVGFKDEKIKKAWDDYKKADPLSDEEMKIQEEERVEDQVDHEIAPNLKSKKK